ncbi:hypothetical protein CEB3_c25470 [Peptococcaceae bacterium CEB3]|nr:hypothetical protein CEB3_c25470 [Peptococcaceae bacterium CEB3]
MSEDREGEKDQDERERIGERGSGRAKGSGREAQDEREDQEGT